MLIVYLNIFEFKKYINFQYSFNLFYILFNRQLINYSNTLININCLIDKTP